MSKCLGCGVETSKNYCERCFKIKNYGINVHREDKDYSIKTADGIKVLVLNALFLPKEISIKENVLVIVNKRDLIPDISDQRIIDYVADYDINPIDIIVISALKNYNMDYLYDSLKEFNNQKLYFIGDTKSGKTAIINKLLYDYKNVKNTAISLEIPNITSDVMEYKFGKNTIIDTPSKQDDSILSKLDTKKIKEITPVRIKQTIYQKNNTIFNISDIISAVCTEPIFFYFNQDVLITRSKEIIDGFKYTFDLKPDEDLVIENMGYIHTNGKIEIITYENINIYSRKTI